MDYIPRNDADFDKWASNLVTYVKSKTVDFKEPEWPDILPEHVNELVEAYDEWKAAYERTLVPHTSNSQFNSFIFTQRHSNLWFADTKLLFEIKPFSFLLSAVYKNQGFLNLNFFKTSLDMKESEQAFKQRLRVSASSCEIFFEKCQTENCCPHTPGATAAKNEKLDKLKKLIRVFVKRYIHFPPRTNEDLVNVGIRPYDPTRTPHIEVTELAEFELDLRGRREVLVKFWVKGSSGKAKPAGYDGAVIVWQILNKAPAGIDELVHHAMASRTPHALKFTEAERGKTVYIAMAWQNARGNLGDWSEIQSAFIP